jgi:hypothetical protein
MHLFVDTVQAKATAIDPGLRAKLDPIVKAHASLPVPPQAGKAVGSPTS